MQIVKQLGLVGLMGYCFVVPLAYSWDGTTSDGNSITIESYDHRGRGEGEVEYYDHETGENRTGYLDMYPGGSGELIDDETGESIDVDMD
jgi:hypothetical protein